jgi:hypothetical protein
MLAVVITDAAREGEFQFERRKFGATESELRQLVAWLTEHEVREAVMESTAQYWKPVWQQLEGQCELYLRRRTPIEPREAASETSPTPSGCCGAIWLES